jgi:hypothetical protein
MDPLEYWDKLLNPDRVGDDLGEKPREVKGDPLTEDDADAFAKYLGIE